MLRYPPGTSKWNRVEHRLFSYISINGRGKPLTSYQVINLIAATTTSTGLMVYARLDENEYPTKIRVTNAELAAVKIERHAFHGDWNYTVYPTSIKPSADWGVTPKLRSAIIAPATPLV